MSVLPRTLGVIAVLAPLVNLHGAYGADGASQAAQSWASTFDVVRSELTSRGRNTYFILEPGYRLTLEHGRERLVVTVLDETRIVDGVETRIIEERETNGDRLVEVSRNFFAIDRRTSDVFYFGEDVDEYAGGRISSHGGSWLAGVKEARAGLMMPGQPVVGARFYQELAPGVAMDRAEIVSLTGTLTTAAGRFTRVLRTRETTPLEPLARESKFYAPGVGLIQDGSLKLVKYGS